MRKESRNLSYDGVVIATCRNEEEKKNIMKAKSPLKDSRRFIIAYLLKTTEQEKKEKYSRIEELLPLSLEK